ncbi:unnamed protein product [Rangifer tarandus platyrhynchus]|uniref:Uncharacterized protein n=1 Tax=Rangifer tarandus platyrhynchus TaxID=3082113 RepID=A0AC59ZAN8_RANTA
MAPARARPRLARLPPGLQSGRRRPPPPAPRSRRRRLRPRLPRTAPASPRGAGRAGGGAPWRPRGWTEPDPRGHPGLDSPPTAPTGRDLSPDLGHDRDPRPQKTLDPDVDHDSGHNSAPRRHDRPWPGPHTGIAESAPLPGTIRKVTSPHTARGPSFPFPPWSLSETWPRLCIRPRPRLGSAPPRPSHRARLEPSPVRMRLVFRDSG